MFGNYPTIARRHIQPDVGYFDVRGNEEAFLKAKPPLSEEIIQSYKAQSPWPSSPTFEGDFVLVCEFSELEGPKPVMTIPIDSGGDFDQNEFALKIMAIDYNATNIVRSSGSFTLVEDTGVILEEPKESAFAYVHHFTLYDVIARGYVRPFCIAYITSDQRKIIRNLDWLMTQFRKVSGSFHFGNLCQFQRELKCRLADLHYTIDDMQNQPPIRVNGTTSQHMSADGNDGEAKCKSNQKYSALEKGIREVQDILEILAPELINSKLESQFKRLEELSSAKNLRVPRKHHNSSSIHEEGYHSDGEEKPKESGKRTVRRTSTCDSLSNLQSSLDTPSPYTPQIIRVDGYRKFDIRLKTLHELCGWAYKDGLSRVRKLHKHLSRDHLILYMERKESTLVDPTCTSALLTIGRAVTMNFMQDISLRCMANDGNCQEETGTQCGATLRRLTSVSTSSVSPSSLDENLLMKQPSLSYEAMFVPGTPYASMESLYYDVNESLDQSSDDEEISEIPKKLLSSCTFIPSDDGSWLDIDVASKEYAYSSSTDTSTSQPFKGRYYSMGNTSKTGGTPPDEIDDSTSEKETTANHYVENSNLTSTSSSSGYQLQDSPVPTHTADSYIVRRHQKVSVGSYVSRINSFRIYLPGSGVRNMIGQYSSFAIHLVYALLIGRTVIVVASPRYEKEVTALIRTLWVFVPGHSSKHHLVVPWHTQPVCLLDMNHMKLIGLCRHKSSSPNIPTDVQEYSTVFDYESSTLYTPPYKGFHLKHVIKSCKHFRSDRAYIAFIHSHFLELAQKAFVYYHSFCLNSPNFQPMTDNEAIKMGNSQIKHASIGYLSKLGIADGDIAIIEYWVSIIKQQQRDEMYLQAVSTVIPTPSVHQDYRQCKLYQYHT